MASKYTPKAVQALGQRGQAMAAAYKPQIAKPAAVPKAVYQPTNPGWGNAATAAKLKELNPSGTATWGWTPAMGQDYANQVNPPQLGDFGGSIGGGPGGGAYWGAALSALEAQRDEALGAAKIGAGSRIRQALIDLGLEDTSQLSEDIKGYIDAPTLAAAKANKYSVFAQAATQARKASAQSRAALAARGMLSSGQLTKEAQDIVEAGEKTRYMGVRDFTGQSQGVLEQLAQAQRDWAGRIAEARMRAASEGWGGGGGGGGGGTGGGGDIANGARPGEWADLPLATGWEPWRNTDATYDMSGATPDGQGGYIGPQGQRYDEKGRVR